jgi:threonine dehydratase
VSRPTRESVEAAYDRILGRVRRTPVLELGPDETGVDARVLLKLELFQHTGSFKARGALNSVLTLTDGAGGAGGARDVAGVAAASGGNHGAAVAWAARQAGLTADVFAPAAATPAKLERIEEYGAKLHRVDGHVGEALDACRAFCDEQSAPMVHPYDTFETTSGAGTLGLETAEQVPDADLMVLACGGGGLYSGVATALGGRIPVQPVEPDLCPHLAEALAAGRPVPHTSGGAAADSLGPPQIGDIAFATATDLGVTPVLVDEGAVLAARRFLWQQARVLAEPGASVALAGVLTGRVPVSAGSTVVVVVSGGNNATLP